MIEKGSVRQGDGAERSLRSAMVLNFIVKSEKRAAAQSRSAMVLNFTVRLENCGGETVKQERGAEYYSTIGRKGGEARTALEKPEVDQNQEQPPSEATQSTTTTTNTQVSTTA